MEVDKIQEAFREMRFTSGLSDEDAGKLGMISEWVEFPAATTIFAEGNQTDYLYLIANGRVELSMSIPEKGLLPILTLESGDLLGGSPALLQGEMTMTATAILDTEAVKVDANALRVLCESDHDIGYEVMRRVAMALMNRLVATRLQVLDVHRDAAIGQGQVASERQS